MGLHKIRHNFKEEMVLPIAALQDSLKFVLDDSIPKQVITADNITCTIVKSEWHHILDLEDKIREIYNIDVLTFLKKWYISTDRKMRSLECVLIKVKKEK